MTIAVLGPQRSGKTSSLLSQYRDQLRQLGNQRQWHRLLWLAPHPRAAAVLRDQLLGQTLAVCFAPGVTTFDEFAEGLLARSATDCRFLTPSAKRHLLKRLVEASATAGTLDYFGRISGTRGFVDLLEEFFREASRGGISPEKLSKSVGRRGDAAKQRQLARIYEEYQELLQRHRLYDADRRLWLATQTLDSQPTADGCPWKLVVVDGFTSFTAAEHAMLRCLARRTERLVISLPGVPPSEEAANRPDYAGPVERRADLFASTRATVELLRRHHPKLTVERSASPTDGWPAMEHLIRHLFDNPRQIPPPSAEITGTAPRIRVISASSEHEEIVQIAQRIKQMLASGEAAADQITVVYRTLYEVAPRIEEVFGEFGIPYTIEIQPPLIAAPAVKTLMNLVRLAVEDWPYRRLLAVVNNRLLTALESRELPATQPAGSDRTAADSILRQLQVTKGREAVIEQLEYWRSRSDGESVESTAQAAANATAALPLVQRLADGLDDLPSRASPSQWASALVTLGRRLGLAPFAEPKAASRATRQREQPTPAETLPPLDDRGAWQRIVDALASIESLYDRLDESAPQWSQRDLLHHLQDIASHEFVPKPQGGTGRVRVLSAPTACALSVPHVFLAGLSEQSFPLPERAGRLYSDDDLQFFARVDDQEQRQIAVKRQQEEMLLFYRVATSATGSLVLSYAALDDKAQTLPPSPYVNDLIRTLGGERVVNVEPPQLQALPTAGQPLSPAQWRVLAVDSAIGRRNKDSLALMVGLVKDPHTAATGSSILRALTAAHRRSRGESFGPMEGVLEGAAVQQLLAARFGPDHLWSPSQLEAYAVCPFRFFMEQVLGLVPLRDLVLDTDRQRRGVLLHEALAEYHRRQTRAEAAQDESAPVDEDEFLRILDEQAKARAGIGLDGALVEIERRQLADWVKDYVEQETEYRNQSSHLDQPLTPTHFEVRFGPPRHGEARDDEDFLSTNLPFTLTIGDEAIGFTGRIDRIDVGASAGQTVFNVIDYKSGKKGRLKDEHIESGRQLQLPLYAMAAQELLLADEGAVPLHAGYWTFCGGGFDARGSLSLHEIADDGAAESKAWSEQRPRILARVQQLIAGIRHGEFPMFNTDENCTRNCPFSTVCRVAGARSVNKEWPAPESESTGTASPTKNPHVTARS